MSKELENSAGADAGNDVDNESLPAMTIRPVPGFLRFMPEMLRNMASLGATFKMEQDGGVAVDGFYKNGAMRLEIDDKGRIEAVDRRERRTPINSWDDLVMLNYQWWLTSNSKSHYVMPGRPWLDSFIEKRLVKRKVIFEPIDAAIVD